MKIDESHFLEGVARELLPGGSPMKIRRALIIHFTAGASGLSSISFWRSAAAKGACAHLVIERDGQIIQCRAFNRTCGHAGKSRWKDPKTGKLYINLNHCSIGIELANAGNDDGALSWARKQPGFASIRASHRNGGPEVEWELFPVAQVRACERIAVALVERYNLDDVTSHDAVAPERKDDVGPAFPMNALRSACGFGATEPVVHRA